MNSLVERLNNITKEIERLKVVKQKSASLLHMREYQLEVQVVLTRNGTFVASSSVWVRTVTSGGETALVSMYYDGEENDPRMFEFLRYVPYSSQNGEMGFVVSCVRPSDDDYAALINQESITITVPLRIVATSEIEITTEEFDDQYF